MEKNLCFQSENAVSTCIYRHSTCIYLLALAETTTATETRTSPKIGLMSRAIAVQIVADLVLCIFLKNVSHVQGPANFSYFLLQLIADFYSLNLSPVVDHSAH